MDKASYGYEIHETLYESARTIVYRGIRQPGSLPVVIKALRADTPRPGDIAALRREFRVTRRLLAPGVVRVYGLEPWMTGLALIQEDIGGSSLDRQLKTFGAKQLHRFFDVALPITRALVAIHDQVVHGDISPANILCNPATL